MFIVGSGRGYHPKELHPNHLNSDIYGDEKADLVLMENLRQKGQIESVTIKEDKTIISVAEATDENKSVKC